MVSPLVALPDVPDRPRERLAALGAEALSDHELLALLLGGGRADVAAHALLRRFGSLHGLDRAGLAELRAVPGLGLARAAALKAALTLGRRAVTRERTRGPRIRSAEDVHARLSPVLRHHDREVFAVVLLDTRHRILSEVRVAEGGLTACAIHPREVFEPAIREGAAAIIFVHNHPSGDPTPSQEDLALTTRLCITADALGVRALDHVIIGDGGYVSLADRGLMARCA